MSVSEYREREMIRQRTRRGYQEDGEVCEEDTFEYLNKAAWLFVVPSGNIII